MSISELQLQANAIRTAKFAGIGKSDFLSQEAYFEWRKVALNEAESILQQLMDLPEFNGLIEITVLGGEHLEMRQRGGFLGFSKAVPINPYVSVFLEDGERVAHRCNTDVVHNADSPTWGTHVPPLVISSEAAEIQFKVKHCGGSQPSSSSDKVVGKCGLRVMGLRHGITQTITLNIYGHISNDVCLCWLGSGSMEDETEFSDNKLKLKLRYIEERRNYQSDNSVMKADTYQRFLKIALCDPMPIPSMTEEGGMSNKMKGSGMMNSFSMAFKKKQTKDKEAQGTPQTPLGQVKGPVDVHAMFHQISAAMWSAFKLGSLASIPLSPHLTAHPCCPCRAPVDGSCRRACHVELYLRAAASGRMQSDLVVTDGNLPDAIIMVSQEVKTAIADLERDLEVQQSLKDLQKHFALGNAQLRYQTLTQHFQAIFARNPGASGSAMTSIWRLEDTVTEHHKQLVDNKLAKDPSTGSEAPPSSSDRGSDASHQIHELVHLYNLDSEITSAMHEWIHLGSIDMKDQMERLMEAEAWTPVAPQQRIAACGVEMQRIINASLDVWLEHTLSGSTQRKENVGKAMIDSLVSVLSAYATTFSQPFKSSQDSRLIVAKLSTRLQEEEVFSVTSFFQPKLNMSGRVSVAASVRDSAGVYDSPRGLTPQQSFNRNSRGTKKPLVSGRTLAFVKSLSIGYHKSYKSVDTVQSPHEKHAIIQLLEVEQGICLTELMCIVANTLDKLVQDARELGKNLRLALEDDEEEIAQREKSGTRPIRLSIEIPEGPEDRPSASRLNSSPLRTVKTAKPKGKSRKPKKAAFAVDEDRTSRHSPRLTPRALMGFRGSVTTNVMERDRIVAEVKRGMKEERRKEKKQKKVYTPGSRKFNKAVKSVRIHRKQTSLSSTISGGSSTPETSSSDKASSDDSDSHSDSYDTHNNKNPSFMDDASLASESYESFQAQQSKGESLSMKAVYNNALFMADPLGGSGRGSSGSNKKASWGKYFPPASIGNSPRGGRTSWNSRGHSKVSSTHSKSNQPDSLLTLDPSTCGASPRQSDQEHLRDMSMQASPYTQGGQRKTMWSSFSNSLAGRQKPRADGPASSHQVELEVPEELPPPPKISFVETAWQELSIHLEEVVTSIQMSYAVQYRDTLLALLILAFGKKPEDETSVKVLSDILTAIHDELVMMGNNMADEERRKVLASMVEASWQAALATLNLLVLNQAGFRPLGEVEAETTRQFLTSLQDMYNEFGEEREPEGSTAPEQRHPASDDSVNSGPPGHVHGSVQLPARGRQLG
eukprot:gene10375-8315_t